VNKGRGSVSIELVRKAIKEFIETDTAETMCVKGKWGVGKTYAWNKFFRECMANKSVGMKTYSYASLFGINSVDELRQAIFENITSTNDRDDQSIEKRLKSYARTASQKASKFANYAKIPYLDSYVNNLAGGFRHIVASTIRDSLICIDDIERKGKDLRVADVLGVVSQLKETKNCKIALLYNEGALENDDRLSFDKYFEKVIDISLQFEPTAEEAASIAIDVKDKFDKLIQKGCVDLDITNIRIIKKIELAVKKVLRIVDEFADAVKEGICRTLIVLAWSTYGAEGAPSLQYLKHRRYSQNFGIEDKEVFSDDEVRWGSILDGYGFSHCDEFDLILISGLQKGVFDEHDINKECEKLQDAFQQNQGDTALTEAWKIFHDSFDANEAEVAQSLYDGSIQNLRYLSPMNLNAAVSTLKALGENEKAATLIQHYEAERAEEVGLFDLSRNPFHGEISDPDVIATFKERSRASQQTPTPLEACRRILKGAWEPIDEEVLEALTLDQVYELFKRMKGDDLRELVTGCLEFRKFGNATERQAGIGKKAEDALKKIAAESSLNRLRMRKFRVNLD
jgi:hypothetical protein